MRIILFGHNGKLGKSFCRFFEMNNISYLKFDRSYINQNLENHLQEAILTFKPTHLINCIALNNDKQCSANYDLALFLNSELPKLLSIFCSLKNIQLLHFSTESVFYSDSIQYVDELCTPNPINIYGKSKLLGENNILTSNHNSYIVRLPMLFGHLNSSEQTIERLTHNLINNQSININQNVYTNPTFTDDIPNGVLTMLRNHKCGIYHMANNGEYSLHNFFQLIAKKLNKNIDIIPFEGEHKRAILKSTKLSLLRSTEEALSDYLKDYIK